MRQMKDSGIEWIGEIPINWEMIKVKRCFRGVKRLVGASVDRYDRLALTLNGVVKRSKDSTDGLQPEKFEGYQILKKHELVFKLIDLQNVKTSRVGLSSYDGIVSPAYIILTNKSFDNRFFYYWFMFMYYNEVFNYLGGDGVRSALNMSDVLALPIPSISEQAQYDIANYLDKKCKQIDAIIDKQQLVIEKLKAYKLSIITETVTKGLDSDIEMKDSGIEWIGKIPKHWNLKKLKFLFRIKKDIANKEGLNILSVTQKGLKIKDITSNEGQVAANYKNYQIVEIGDFAMNHMDLLTGWIDISSLYGVTSPDYRVFKLFDANSDARYYLYLFQNCYLNKIFYGLGQGVSSLGRWRLQADKFLNFLLPIPSLDEQNEIVNYLEEKISAIEEKISTKIFLIDKLIAYKKSLIYEMVTGKKEV